MSADNRLVDALVAWSDAVDRMSLDEDGVDYLGEIVRQARHLDERGLGFAPQRFTNCRGKLHGLQALRRVLDSDTLRRMALDLWPSEYELERELQHRALVAERRKREAARERVAQPVGALHRLMGLVLAALGRAP